MYMVLFWKCVDKMMVKYIKQYSHIRQYMKVWNEDLVFG